MRGWDGSHAGRVWLPGAKEGERGCRSDEFLESARKILNQMYETEQSELDIAHFDWERCRAAVVALWCRFGCQCIEGVSTIFHRSCDSGA